LLELVATGPNPDERWRRRLPEGQTIRVGRAPLEGWAVPWDLRISREHVDLLLVGERLVVQRIETARNPVYRFEQPAQHFELGPGEDFRIGGTTFRLERISADMPVKASAGPSGAAAASEMEALKAQVAALQSQLAAYADARNREKEAAPSPADAEVELLRAQVEALKEQVTTQRRPADEKDRQIAELKAQLEQARTEHTRPPAEPPPEPSDRTERQKPPERAEPPPSAESPPAERSERSKRGERPPVEPEPQPAAKASPKPDVEALKARLEAQAAAKRKLRREATNAPAASDSADSVSPGNGVQRGERKSTLFVLKAQIEAQSLKMRREGLPGAASLGDSRQSDVEALKALLEARAEEQRQAQALGGKPGKSASSRRSSHIAALLALHDARHGERDPADRSSLNDNSDETDPPQSIEAGGVVEDTENWPSELIGRIWRDLPGDVREVVREVATGFVVDESVKARIVAALNRLLVGRGFLTDDELQEAVEAIAEGAPSPDRRWSEADLRRAARHVLAGALPGLPAQKRAATPQEVDRSLSRGQTFGVAEVVAGQMYGASYLAAANAAETGPPVELVRIDAESLAQLREGSAGFRAAWERASPDYS
jgi:hypothetical protein